MMAFLAMATTALMGTMDEGAKVEAIDSVLKLIDQGYSYPEVGSRMVKAVRERQSKGEYKDVTTGSELAERLTRDLREVSHDLHLRVAYFDQKPAEEKADQPKNWIEEARKQMAPMNFGLQKAEVLAGNVGYLDFRFFAPLEVAGPTYEGAMATIANTDALIFDIRQNGGSMSPDTIPYLLGYLFAQPTHLVDMTWRGQPTRQMWTSANVVGTRYLDKPVYVLTSGRTFSGAEEFAYDLQAHKRATIVGDTTGGGANPGGTVWADDHFQVWLPMGRVESAVTGKNWEGVGVKPDVAVPALTALAEAHRMALAKLGRKEFIDSVEAPKVKTVRFSLAGHPQAKQAFVAGSFNYWSDHATPMKHEGGAWVADVPVETGKVVYKFVVDGQWMADPANPEHSGPNQDSVRVVE